jgi:hypothetical protein
LSQPGDATLQPSYLQVGTADYVTLSQFVANIATLPGDLMLDCGREHLGDPVEVGWDQERSVSPHGAPLRFKSRSVRST